MTISFFDAEQVERLLDYQGCIEAVRDAMIALSSGERPQPLRQIFTVGDGQSFGAMPGELQALSTFGAKAGQRVRRAGQARPVAPPRSRRRL